MTEAHHVFWGYKCISCGKTMDEDVVRHLLMEADAPTTEGPFELVFWCGCDGQTGFERIAGQPGEVPE